MGCGRFSGIVIGRLAGNWNQEFIKFEQDRRQIIEGQYG